MSAKPSTRVLIVEDEKDVSELMKLHLSREGFDISTVDNGEAALNLLKTETYQLIVLDWMLPGLSGLDICKRLRSDSATSRVPVLMVTARADTTDIVLGLEVGADDYITKPFELPVFLARARSLLRRAEIGEKSEPDEVIQVGNLKIDLKSHQAFCETQELQLTPSEFKLLSALMKNRGRALSRDRLIALVQGDGVTVVDRAIDTHVFGLRKKLGPCSEIIETIRAVGYRVRT